MRSRLLLLVLCATLLPAILIWMRYYQERTDNLATASQQLASAAAELARDIDGRVYGTAQLHFGLSRARDLDTEDRAACSKFLNAVREEHPQYTGILTIRPDGSLFCDSLMTARNLDLRDRGYFRQAALLRSGVALEPLFGRLTGIAVLQIAHPVRSKDGALRYVLLASLNLRKVVEEYKAVLFPGMQILLVDTAGTVLSGQPGNLPGVVREGESIAGSELFRFAVSAAGRASAEVGSGDEARVWSVARPEVRGNAGLYVLAGVSKRELDAAASRRLAEDTTILALAVAALFLAVWLLAEIGIRRPVERIAQMVRRLGHGELDARVALPHPRGELGTLMSELNSTAASLQQQRDAIEELNRRLHLLGTAVSRLNDIVLITEAGSVDEPGPKIVFVNEAFERITGYSSAEAVGRSPRMLQGALTRREELDRVRAALQHNLPVRVELINYTKSGKPYWIEMQIAPLADERGTVTHLVAVEHDITDRKHAEEALRNLNEDLEQRVESRTTQLQLALQDQEAFAYTVSHDLRAPLRAIGGFATLLETTQADRLDERGRHLLGRVNANIARMAELIDGVLEVSRIGRTALNPVRIDMRELVCGVAAELRESYPQAPELELGELPEAPGDPLLLRQVWQNLLSNACKFSAGAAQPHVRVEGRREGEWLRYSVSDNGVGFDPAYADKLFGLFERLHEQSEFPGTGVGLMIVRRAIERHGGTVSGSSGPGGGATFSFTLPCRPSPPPDPAPSC